MLLRALTVRWAGTEPPPDWSEALAASSEVAIVDAEQGRVRECVDSNDNNIEGGGSRESGFKSVKCLMIQNMSIR